MRPQYEKVPRDSRASFYTMVRADPSFPFNWHYHPEYELTLIVDSFGQRLVGDGIADYGPGDLVLLGPNLPHSWRSIEGGPAVHRAIVVQFKGEFLGDDFLQLEEMSAIARLLERSSCGLAFGETPGGWRAAALLGQLPALTPSRRLVRLLWVLQELAEEPAAKPLSLGRLRPTYRIEYQDRLDTVCAYLEEHFAEEIDHAAVARLVHMDSASLCRFFKRATGRTITVYVNEFRVAAASRLLLETTYSVLEIGNRVGFANHSNFNRQFKRLKKISPGALRKEFRADPAKRRIA